MFERIIICFNFNDLLIPVGNCSWYSFLTVVIDFIFKILFTEYDANNQ